MAKIAWTAAAEEMAAVIARARELHARHAQALLRHPRVPALLERYGQAIAATARLTEELGIPAYCMACAARDAVCCFAEVSRRYDEHLLLINLLLGDAGAWDAPAGPTCYFCGPSGCVLTAKCSFCLNFYCQAIKSGLGAENLARLNRTVGQELQCQWELERVVMPWVWEVLKNE